MKKGIKLFSAAVLGLAAVACSSPEKMAEMAENVTVKCEPAVLEVVGGEIDATVSVGDRSAEGLYAPARQLSRA